jgi:hypothetical protein
LRIKGNLSRAWSTRAYCDADGHAQKAGAGVFDDLAVVDQLIEHCRNDEGRIERSASVQLLFDVKRHVSGRSNCVMPKPVRRSKSAARALIMICGD